jgi:hypothetical protein
MSLTYSGGWKEGKKRKSARGRRLRAWRENLIEKYYSWSASSSEKAPERQHPTSDYRTGVFGFNASTTPPSANSISIALIILMQTLFFGNIFGICWSASVKKETLALPGRAGRRSF